MRKQELLHLHQLLYSVRTYLEADAPVPTGAFAEYDAYGVGPNAFDRQKGDHEAAIRRLLAGIVATIADRREAESRDRVAV
ncbi:UPF0058 family protein [Haloarchaeobius sp. TZWWS8]|uniref:UPF0058 family protein n=1 Tax=Haloarchaeobius sp. TZWWS8 TaxID=3446121 RepID=UPI003EBE1FA4